MRYNIRFNVPRLKRSKGYTTHSLRKAIAIYNMFMKAGDKFNKLGFSYSVTIYDSYNHEYIKEYHVSRYQLC